MGQTWQVGGRFYFTAYKKDEEVEEWDNIESIIIETSPNGGDFSLRLIGEHYATDAKHCYKKHPHS